MKYLTQKFHKYLNFRAKNLVLNDLSKMEKIVVHKVEKIFLA